MRAELVAAVRGLRRSPVLTVASMAVLALSSGATTTVLAVVSALLMRPLPIVDQDRVAIAWKEDYQAGFAHFPFSYQSVVALEQHLTTVSDLATIDYNGAWPLSTIQGDRGYRLPVGMVSGNLFPLLGVRPILGRVFTREDDIIGGPRIILIGESYWRSHYQTDRDVVGRPLTVFGIPHEIIGVLPDDFAYPKGALAWIPMFTAQGEWLNNPDAVTQDIVVRLKPGRTVTEFRADLELARTRTASEQRGDYATHRIIARSWSDEVLGNLGSPLLLLGLGAAVLLVVASANVGALLLVRSGGRLHELAVRVALGAPRARVLWAALLEYVLIVILSIVAGLVLTWFTLRIAEPLLPPDLGRMPRLPFAVLPVTVAILLSLTVAFVAGLGPAMVLMRSNVADVLRAAGRFAAFGLGTHPVRRALVAGQMFLAVAAVGAAGLLVRSIERLYRIDVGFDPDRLLLADVTRSPPIADTVLGRAWWDRTLEEVSRVPEVASVAANLSPPFVGNAGGYAKLSVEGRPEDATLPLANYESVTPAYFATMGTRLVRGRLLLASDNETAPPVIVITQRLAELLWPGQDPIGRRLGAAIAANPRPRWKTVVGVIADTRYNDLTTPVPTFLVPYRQIELLPWYLLVRTRSGAVPSSTEANLRRAITAADPAASLVAVTPMTELLRKPLGTTKVVTGLTTGFGFFALVLAGVGVYGLLSSLVLQRRREIGIRMAIGADGAAIGALIARQAALSITMGLAGGVAVSLMAGRWLGSFLYQVGPTDPLALGAVTGTFVIVAAVAILLPVRSATRTDAAAVLRSDG